MKEEKDAKQRLFCIFFRGGGAGNERQKEMRCRRV